ncbi:MAG: hypothetical protein AMXMBFR53_35310 [Gemmatimonadota bacterium]
MQQLRYSPLSVCAVLALGIHPCGARLAAQVVAPFTEPITIPLEPWVGRFLTVRGTIEGRPVSLLFDTGGGETLVAPRLLDEIGCAPEGRSVGYRMSGERVEWARCGGLPIEVAGTTLRPRTLGSFDIMALFGDQLPAETPPVDGVLSLDVARGRQLTLDLAASTLTIETDGSFRERTSHMHEVPARVATGPDGGALTVHLRATLRETANPVWLLLDSGNLAGLLLDESVALRGMEGTDVHLDFGEGVSVTAIPRRAGLIYDGALSWREIRALVVTLDLEEGRAWLGVQTLSDPGAPPQGGSRGPSPR